MAMRLRRLVDACLDLLFPPPERCLLCGRVLADGNSFCASCLAGLAHPAGPHCPRCGRPFTGGSASNLVGCVSCAGKQWSFTAARSLGPYQGDLRLLVQRLKFRGREQYGRLLADQLYRSVERAWWSDCDALVPVPLHAERLRQRGFNQAEVIADRLALLSGRPLRRLLQRTLATSAQTGLSQRQRQQNVQQAFALARGQEPQVSGRCLLLVDDVLTTGSTADACARVLCQAGAKEVRVATLAITNLPA